MAPVDVTRWKITKVKPALILPEIRYAYVGVPLSPVNYLCQVEAAGKKFSYLLPPVAAIGPKFKCLNHVNELVDGIIDYVTLVLLASTTTEEIFKGAKDFKKKVFYTMQSVLNKFGLKFVDVNRGHKYFLYLEPHNNNQAKIDVSKPRIKGAEIGAKPREALTTQNVAAKTIDVGIGNIT